MTNARTHGAPKAERPLSPHLQIYAPLINMVMSILHRLTGATLYFGTILLACWLLAAAMGKDYFDSINGLFATYAGKAVLFGYSWILLHHMLGGVRHLIWDTGRGFDLRTIDRLSWGTIIGSAILTLVVWGIALSLPGDL